MIKRNIILIFSCFFLLVSCCFFSSEKKLDSDLIADFSPLNWDENYVFGASQYPPCISVWNSQNGKLIRQYNFYTADNAEDYFADETKGLIIHTMEVVDKSVWCITFGNQCSLVKIDILTGEVMFIDLEQRYDYLNFIPEANNGKGAILVVPYVQYMEDFNILLFDLDGAIIQTFEISESDIDIISSIGQYKNGLYYFCASSHLNITSGEPGFGIYKIIKLNLESGFSEVVPLSTKNVIGENFVRTYMPSLYNNEYVTSFSVKPCCSEDGKIMISIDFIGFDKKLEDYDSGRFLFETDDLSLGKFVFSGKYLIDSKDVVQIFPRVDSKIDNNYSIIGNDGGNLFAVFFNDQNKDVFFMPNAEIICMDKKEKSIWCEKNAYTYSERTNEWIYDKEGIYRVDLINQKVSLYQSNGLY